MLLQCVSFCNVLPGARPIGWHRRVLAVADREGRAPTPLVAHLYCLHLGLNNNQHVLHHLMCRLKHEALLLLLWVPRPPPGEGVLTMPKAKAKANPKAKAKAKAKPKAKAEPKAKAKADTLNPRPHSLNI